MAKLFMATIYITVSVSLCIMVLSCWFYACYICDIVKQSCFIFIYFRVFFFLAFSRSLALSVCLCENIFLIQVASESRQPNVNVIGKLICSSWCEYFHFIHSTNVCSANGDRGTVQGRGSQSVAFRFNFILLKDWLTAAAAAAAVVNINCKLSSFCKHLLMQFS